MSRKYEREKTNVTYAELRRGINELELNLLQIPTRGVNHQRLADRDDTLLRARDRTLEHEEVVLDDAVMGEATHRGDGLLGDIVLSRGVGVILARADAVDLLVELGTVVVTVCLQNIQHVFS